MTEPIPVRVTRYRCPHCGRSYAAKQRCADHISRCWYNPDALGCKTCKHYSPAESPDWTTGYGGMPEGCEQGVDLSGRPACERCQGDGMVFDAGSLGVSECPECGGDGAEIKPGPIVGCDRWEEVPA